jgi:DNA-directed RNA polymerase specialized sigma24 family protein
MNLRRRPNCAGCLPSPARPSPGRFFLVHYADPERPDESVSDLVQEASLRAWQNIGQFHGAGNEAKTWGKFCSWLKTLTRNTAKTRRRDRGRNGRQPVRPLVSLDASAPGTGRTPAADVAGGEPTPSTNMRANEKACLVLEAVVRLPDEKDREPEDASWGDGKIMPALGG